jgi:hypothetical protein
MAIRPIPAFETKLATVLRWSSGRIALPEPWQEEPNDQANDKADAESRHPEANPLMTPLA